MNNNVKFNKGRTMPIFNRGVGLSLFAFVKEKIVVQKIYYIYYTGIEGLGCEFFKKVRAGP